MAVRVRYSLRAVNERMMLHWRLVRRATRRTNRLVTGRLSVALVLAAIGAIIAAVFATAPTHAWQIIGAGLLGPVVVSALILGYQMLWYQRSGYRDEDWLARHDDSAPGTLLLMLEWKSSTLFSEIPEMECRVSMDRGDWTVIPDDDLRMFGGSGKLVLYPFHWTHELHPGSSYEVRWYRMDRSQLAEITRETFQLRVHPDEPSPGV